MSAAAKLPQLVAHRGYARRYPENTLIALQAAVEAGARFIEFDIQLTRDAVPVLLHDALLARTMGIEGCIMDLTLDQVRALNEQARLRRDNGPRPAIISTLADVVAWLASCAHVTAFVELKKESLAHFGIGRAVDRVISALAPVMGQSVIISFDAAAIQFARTRGATIGLVLDRYDADILTMAGSIGCAYLFCDHTRLPAPPAPLHAGPWQWVIYEVETAEHALELAARGAHLIETMNIGDLKSHPAFQSEGKMRARPI